VSSLFGSGKFTPISGESVTQAVLIYELSDLIPRLAEVFGPARHIHGAAKAFAERLDSGSNSGVFAKHGATLVTKGRLTT